MLLKIIVFADLFLKIDEKNEIIFLEKGIILKYDKNKTLKWDQDLHSIEYF